MIDVHALKTSIDLLSLASVRTTLKRVASSGGGEWAGPCPFCGGEDRFRVQPQAPDGGRWLCRQCGEGKWQDAIEFGRRLWPGLSFTQVCDLLAEGAGGAAYSLPTRRGHPVVSAAGVIEVPAYHAPQISWQAAARQALVLSERALWSAAGQPALDYLRRRGLHDETIRYWRLGWSQGMKIPLTQTLTPALTPKGGGEKTLTPNPSPLGGGGQEGDANAPGPGNGQQGSSLPSSLTPALEDERHPSPKGGGGGTISASSLPSSRGEGAGGGSLSSSSLPSPLGRGAGGEGSYLWIPRGILIPCISLEQIWYLKIALLPGEMVKCQACKQPVAVRKPCPNCGTLNKYRGVKGNRTAAIYGADELQGAQIALFVEGEFDAMIAWQELRDVLAVCTLGSATNRPDLATWGAHLLFLERILVAYDADAPGEKGLQALQALFERVEQLPLPPGVKDINDFVLQGGELWPWIKPVLE